MSKITLSVVLATHNEAENISKCLNSIKDLADEIVVVDGNSSDDTVKIAKSYNAKVTSVPNQTNFHINKNIAIDKATKDWILQLDADEVVSEYLSSEIKSKINSPGEKLGFWMNRKNWFLNRFLTKGGQYPDPTIRLYKRGYGRLPAKDVHEQAVINGPTGQLDNDLLHYRDTSFEKYLDGFNRYSSFIAQQLSANHTTISLKNLVKYLLAKPIVTFFVIYLRHKGFVDGPPGLVFATFSSLVHPVSYIKLWQITKYPV